MRTRSLYTVLVLLSGPTALAQSVPAPALSWAPDEGAEATGEPLPTADQPTPTRPEERDAEPGTDPPEDMGGGAETSESVEAETSESVEPDIRADRAPASCTAEPVVLVRFGAHPEERISLPLTACDGTVRRQAVNAISHLARPRRGEAPPRALAAELIARMQRIAERFPGRALILVSGYRPGARSTSRHHTAHAVDLQVDGVDNESLRDFLLGLPQTGVGYYPNSTFVHLDVRPTAAYWVDRSGPGEPADYDRWRGGEDPVDAMVREALADAERTLESLGHGPELPIAELPPASAAAAPQAEPTTAGAPELQPLPADTLLTPAPWQPPAEPAPLADAPTEPVPPEDDGAAADATAPLETAAVEAVEPDEASLYIAPAPEPELVMAEPPPAEVEPGHAPTPAVEPADEAVAPQTVAATTPARSEAVEVDVPPAPETGPEADAQAPVHPTDPAELRALTDAALFRMNDAFGRTSPLAKSLPDKSSH